MSQQPLDHIFDGLPYRLDIAHIEAQLHALRPPYRVDERMLPLPLWARRPYTEHGEQAWALLQRELPALPSERPLCIYIHIPFCASKCRFCDCYSFRLANHEKRHISSYVDNLIEEMRLWSTQGQLSQRPVSTVHLGGGTPSFLGEGPLRRLVEGCAALFHTTTETEWALESTVSELTPELFASLHELGFRRLHLGVQTLEEPVRQAIGRRQAAAQVLETASAAVEAGWVVSVDLICGLPENTLVGLLDSIRALWEAGVHGFSLYELLIFPQNRRWAEQCNLAGRGHLDSYLMFQAGACYLEQLGYRKNLFNHFAQERDRNVYFTFPTRGEDLLALGAIADGVFGDYHYRHPIYKHYQRQLRTDFPALKGGLRRDGREQQVHELSSAVLAGHIPAALTPMLDRPLADAGQTLREYWLDLALVEPERGGLGLTTNGSWFAGNMITDLSRYAAGATSQRQTSSFASIREVPR